MFKRIGLAILILLIVAITGGLIYESLGARAARRNFPPPGAMVDVGGYRLHLYSMGDKPPETPTILLEHGGSSMVAQWGWIQPALAEHTQVVAYDRPGMGWSEPAPTLLDAEAAVQDFYRALQIAEIEGPYLLVGHSMGGLMVRVFARLYPEETVGLVLIDPVTVERHELLPYGIDNLTLGIIQTVARLGIIRLSGVASQEAAGLPEPYFGQAVAITASHQHMRNFGQEGNLGETSMAFLRQGETLDERPLIVLEAGAPGEGFDAEQRVVLHELYERLVARSNQGSLRIVEGAGHVSVVIQEHHAQAVIDAVLDMLHAQSAAFARAGGMGFVPR